MSGERLWTSARRKLSVGRERRRKLYGRKNGNGVQGDGMVLAIHKHWFLSTFHLM